MARIQTLSHPDGTYSVVVDEAHTLGLYELEALTDLSPELRDLLGARSVLVFLSTVDVV